MKSTSTLLTSRTWSDVTRAVNEIAAPQAGNMRSQNNILITKRMVNLLGLEETALNMPFIHVAGSKGKGTTCAYTAKLLEAQGMKVGLFTSPHLYDVRERFKVNYDLIPKEEFIKYFFHIYDKQKEIEQTAASEFDRQASRSGFFRFTFYLALHAFAEQKCDVIVLETGLGGRIDSTNVVTPKVCGITALGLEHTEVLGDTIELIAGEKAGIIKPRIPVYTAPQQKYPQTLDIIREHAQENESPMLIIDENIAPKGMPNLAMSGDHIAENARLAVSLSRYLVGRSLMEPVQPVERKVLETLTFDGRSQVVNVSDSLKFYLDGAHTTESMELASRWFESIAKESAGKRRNVLMFYTQRDPAKLLPLLQPLRAYLDKVVFTQVEFTRLAPGEKDQVFVKCCDSWSKLCPEVPVEVSEKCLTQTEQYELLAKRNVETLDVEKDRPVNVFVTGSLYLVGTVLKALRGEFTPAPSPSNSDSSNQ